MNRNADKDLKPGGMASRLAEEDSRSPRLSFFEPPIRNTIPSGSLSLPELRDLIAGPKYQGITSELQSLTDPEARRKYKASRFAVVTFSGSFSKRNEQGLLQHSGLLALDLDHLPYLEEGKQLLLEDPEYETQMLFVSPSGNGLKWVLRFNPEEIAHKDFFLQASDHLERRYRLHPDPAAKDVPRACFIPHDPEVYLNSSYE